MIQIAPQMKVLLMVPPIDFRKGVLAYRSSQDSYCTSFRRRKRNARSHDQEHGPQYLPWRITVLHRLFVGLSIHSHRYIMITSTET